MAARVALQSLTRLSALDLARANPIRLDGWVMLFIIVVSATSGLLFGLFPAWQISRPDLVSVLRERSQSDNSPSMRSGNAFGFNTRGPPVVMQVELSVILLIGSTLLLRSIERLHAVNPGLRTSNLLTMHLDLPPLRYNTAAKKEAFFRELIETIDATPGVWSAAAVLTLPTGPKYETNVQIAQQQQVSIVDRPGVQLQIVTPGYFRTAGIAIERGSEFAERDDSGNGLVAIVNESFARRFWADFPNGVDPIGQDVLSGNNTQNGFQIVGVVADVHEQGLVGDLPWQAGYR
ncbi:MAG TPA: ABC transporter permease [Bryobacteraceae bacterium]|nr:ABC transporter permease [Bryobacteraceae bacterium]